MFINQQLNSLIPFLIQINIIISALLLLNKDSLINLKLVCLISSLLIAGFVDTFMQCTSRPSDLMHSYKPIFISYLRWATSLVLMISIISYVFSLSRFLIIIPAAPLLVINNSLYVRFGYRTYRHMTSKTILLLIVVFFQSICITIIIYQFIGSSTFNLVFTIITVFSTISLMVKNKNQLIFNLSSFRIDDIEILINRFQDLADNYCKSDEKCFLIGLLKMHRSSRC